MLSGAFILYSLYYFELDPIYTCTFLDGSTSDLCSQSMVCNPKNNSILTFEVNYKTNKSLRNWIEQYDLGCASKIYRSMIGSCFLAGCFLGSFILPRLADIKGRKPLFLVGLVLYAFAVVGLLVSSNKWLMYMFLVLGGVAETGRYYVAYVYIIEIFPVRLQNGAGLGIFICFAICKVLICLFFMLTESRNWRVCAYVALTLAALSFFLVLFFLPESPRFLFDQKKYTEATQVL